MMRINILFLVCLIFFVTGCSGQNKEEMEPSLPYATPTLHPIFDSFEEEEPDQTESEADSTNTPSIVPEIQTTPIIRPTIAAKVITLYDEELSENWTLENSQEYEYDLEAEQAAYTGRYSIALTPQAGFGKLRLTVAPESEVEYRREDVLAFRFWLYSGDDYIGTEDLSITIVGSNEFPYWVEGDDSVQDENDLDDFPTFPQTRLYFLDFNTDIPPDTWVQVDVWLNELIFDPDYLYVTGMVIENNEDYLNTFYVDDVEMVILE